MFRKHRLLPLLFVLLHFGGRLLSQSADQTVNRLYTQDIPGTPSTLLAIRAEKAAVTITGWEKNYIQLRISFQASHPDKKIAQQELAYMRYALTKEKDRIELTNIFTLPAAIDRIQSKLAIKIELLVPENNALDITDKYGNITLSRLSGKIDLHISFGDLQLTTISGQVKIAATYSEIRGSHVNTTSLHCTDEKSRIAMDLDSGNYTFLSKYGDIDLSLKKISSLDIKSTRTDITLRPQDLNACRYRIVSTDGTLYLPETYAARQVKKGNQYAFITTGATTLPLLAVNANYNSVTIK
ncbi:Putative adhesin [Chitinophaga sp. YR627]|uniref:DUF4097 family beta strand repeat-containing protein n=1 Tax=Chitinophaga sp. YR627 TaxID=1881041 RepID=UPI0008EB7212|nr:DUF4097 family beta strand repeat-containing protein [Chitinophaga sp. YR627]SFN32533.1 Putative adhesin [Chitinophaga sp. YR627]